MGAPSSGSPRRQGLGVGHVERGSSDPALGERPHEGGLVDEPAAGGVDEQGRGLHRPQDGLVDQLMGPFGEGRVQRDDVGTGDGGQQVVAAADQHDVHAEGSRPLRDRRARSGPGLRSRGSRRAARAPASWPAPGQPAFGAQVPFGVAQVAGEREQEGHRQVRRRVGEDVGGAADRDRALGGGEQVDVVDADGIVGDHPQPRSAGDQLAIDAVGEQAEDAVGGGRPLQQPLPPGGQWTPPQLDLVVAQALEGRAREEPS